MSRGSREWKSSNTDVRLGDNADVGESARRYTA